MNPQYLFENVLKSHKLRLTQQTQAIFDIIFECKEPMSAKQIHAKVKNIDLSTIHRTLDRFTEASITIAIYSKDLTRYELGDGFMRHHHHFTCNKCQATFPIHNCLWETLNKGIENEYGKVTSHTIEAYGVCKSCL
jgi:Fur family ferric uptake transcriptional regulator